MGRVDAAMRRAETARGTDFEQDVLPEVLAEPLDTPAPANSPERTAIRFEHFDASLSRKVVVDDEMPATSREQYRRLGAAMHHIQASTGMKAVMITSALPGEGKTLTAANLALTLSEVYDRRGPLIDADLRRPSLHKVFMVEGAPGLTENLIATHDEKLPLHWISTNLAVLPAGKASLDPMSGLASTRMRHIIEEAREAFDFVIVDTPPVGLLSDASLIAAAVDGTLFVVKAGGTPFDLVKRAVSAIGSDHLLGVVLNRAESRLHGYGYTYGYNYYAADLKHSKTAAKAKSQKQNE